MEPTLRVHSTTVRTVPPGSGTPLTSTTPVNLSSGGTVKQRETAHFRLVTLSPGVRRRRRYGAAVE
jgi:hypothetical protein